MAIFIEDGIAVVMDNGVVEFRDDVEEIDIQEPPFLAPWFD